MKSIGLQLKDKRFNNTTVLELLREHIWGCKRGQFAEKERKMLLKWYRLLERHEIKLEKTIYNMEREIHNLENG